MDATPARVPVRIAVEPVSARNATRTVALALVVLVLTAQTSPTKHLIMCNNTASWTLFDVIVYHHPVTTLCRRPDERSMYSYTGTLLSVVALAFKNANCTAPGLGRALIEPSAQQRKEPGLIVAFERTQSGWRSRWLEHRPGFRCEAWENQ